MNLSNFILLSEGLCICQFKFYAKYNNNCMLFLKSKEIAK